MKKHTVMITQKFDAPVARVFATLSDHNQLSTVFGIPVKRIKDGKDSPNGVGSVRRLGPLPMGTQETVVISEPDQLIEYKITKYAGPVQNHYGKQIFSEHDGHCSLAWEIRFESYPVIGDAVAKILELGIKRGLSKLAQRL